jgi:hypothetical protein
MGQVFDSKSVDWSNLVTERLSEWLVRTSTEVSGLLEPTDYRSRYVRLDLS